MTCKMILAALLCGSMCHSVTAQQSNCQKVTVNVEEVVEYNGSVNGEAGANAVTIKGSVKTGGGYSSKTTRKYAVKEVICPKPPSSTPKKR